MPVHEFMVRRFSLVSAKPFDEVVRALTASIGRPDMAAFRQALAGAETLSDLETVIGRCIGASELMEFNRFDAGEVLRKAGGAPGPRMVRLLVGNPLVMQEMARTVPDAASYAPVTILIDQRADGVHLSYDSMASFIAHHGSQQATKVAEVLDEKVVQLLRAAAM
jgi:uncharacterized protein (DUF302 family)